MLLNGASGIAVGLATEVPSHNLREVANAAIALLKNDKLSDDELHAEIPGRDIARAKHLCTGCPVQAPCLDAAIELLRGALAVPSPVSATGLRADPTWAPLRGNPRFEQLVAGK